MTHLVVIGSSTGGPPVLRKLVALFPEDFSAPILIAQHMPPGFTKPLAASLNQVATLAVKEAEEGERVCPGTIYVARSPHHLLITGIPAVSTMRLIDEDAAVAPCIDITFRSAAKIYRAGAIGILLTGLSVGCDGTVGCGEIKRFGGTTFAQDRKTCVVPGIPEKAIEAGVIDCEAQVEEIVKRVVEMVGAKT